MSKCPTGHHCPASLLVADLQQTSPQVNLRSLPSAGRLRLQGVSYWCRPAESVQAWRGTPRNSGLQIGPPKIQPQISNMCTSVTSVVCLVLISSTWTNSPTPTFGKDPSWLISPCCTDQKRLLFLAKLLENPYSYPRVNVEK